MTEAEFWVLIALIAVLMFIIKFILDIGFWIYKKSRMLARIYCAITTMSIIFLLRYIAVDIPAI